MLRLGIWSVTRCVRHFHAVRIRNAVGSMTPNPSSKRVSRTPGRGIDDRSGWPCSSPWLLARPGLWPARSVLTVMRRRWQCSSVPRKRATTDPCDPCSAWVAVRSTNPGYNCRHRTWTIWKSRMSRSMSRDVWPRPVMVCLSTCRLSTAARSRRRSARKFVAQPESLLSDSTGPHPIRGSASGLCRHCCGPGRSLQFDSVTVLEPLDDDPVVHDGNRAVLGDDRIQRPATGTRGRGGTRTPGRSGRRPRRGDRRTVVPVRRVRPGWRTR